MTFGQFLSILRARWRAALVVLLVIFGLAQALNLFMPKSYTASASVLVDMKSPDMFNASAMAGMLMPGYMSTQADLLASEPVVLRAVQSLKMAQNAELRTEWQARTEGRGDFDVWLAGRVSRKLDVKPLKESNIITVSYTSDDARFAAAMANAVVQGFIAVTLEQRVEPAREYNSFFDERSKALRDKLEAAQTRLSVFQRANGILVTDERYDIETARLNELSSQLVALQATAAESGGRQVQARRNAAGMQEVLDNSLVTSLSADLARQEARLKELGSRLGEQNPQVIELRDSSTELRARIAAQTARVSNSLGINDQVNQGRLAQVKASLDEQGAKVLKMKAQRDEAAVMQRDIESAQRAYETVLARASQTSLESQSTQTNVTMLQRATEPPLPSSPKILLNSVVALFLGALLAMGTVILRELMDRRLRTSIDIAELLRQPLLGVLPRTGVRGEQRDQRTAQLQRRVVAGLPQS